MVASINVFALSMHDQVSSPLPKVFCVWGEEPSTNFYIRLDGEFVSKIDVDRGAWGEYDDNPINVRDWQHIMIEVRKFEDSTFVHDIIGQVEHSEELVGMVIIF